MWGLLHVSLRRSQRDLEPTVNRGASARFEVDKEVETRLKDTPGTPYFLV